MLPRATTSIVELPSAIVSKKSPRVPRKTLSCSVTLTVAVVGESGTAVTLTLSSPWVELMRPNVLFDIVIRFRMPLVFRT